VDAAEEELIRYAPACNGAHTGFVVGVLYHPQCSSPRGSTCIAPQQWQFMALGKPAQGRHFEGSMSEVLEALRGAVEIHNVIQYVPGQRFQLSKGDTFTLPSSLVVMGLGWDEADGDDIDLDASVILYDSNGKSTGVVYWGALVAPGLKHHGDNLTGAGDGDDEQITLDLARIEPKVCTMLFVVNIYTPKRTFGDVDNEFCRLYEPRGMHETELCRFEMDYMDTAVDVANTLIMCKIFRHGSAWEMQSLAHPLRNGPRTAVELAKSSLLEAYSMTSACFSPVPVNPNPVRKPKRPPGKKQGSCQCRIA